MRELCDPYRDEYYFLYYRRPYSVETARGCRYRCSFCSVWQFHHGVYKVEGWQRTFEEISRIPDGSYVNIVDDRPCVNLKAPIILVPGSRKACQYILHDRDFPIRYPLGKESSTCSS